MNRPVILCGAGKVGRRIVECLLSDNVPVVVIDRSTSVDLPASVRLVVGECRSPAVLESAGVRSCRGVIVCTSDDLVNMTTVLAIRNIAPETRVVVRSFNPLVISRLGPATANVVPLSVSALAAPLLALIAQTGSALGRISTSSETYQIIETEVIAGSPLCGQALDALGRQFIPLARIPKKGKGSFLADVSVAEPLAAGERIILCGRPGELAEISASERPAEHVRWAGWFRRGWRIAVRAWHEIDRPVKWCTLALFAVVLGSSLVYHRVNDETPAQAFYHTVSVLATVADLHAETLSPAMKVYVSFLRLSGAALLACFTAILTNYLVRARIGRALELRRIPDGGHIVVCGLGNVGFRVVEELRKSGQLVVVVEPARDGRFLASARRLGAAIVSGDATVADVLRLARVDTARAVVAATSNDLVNVEIALLVREIASRQRVVVRLSDADLAKSLREAANIQLAISIPALAAPAFVAALYGDRVQSVFFVGGRLLAAVELTVGAGHEGLDDESVQALAREYRLLPVALATANGQSVEAMLGHRLAPGDRLTAIAALSDLDRLYRRQRA